MANMAARSKALESRAELEAELDAQEIREEALAAEEDEDQMSVDAEDEDSVGPFRLPTAEEREEEKAKGGPDVHLVQLRMRQCVHVLNKFKSRAEKGRQVTFSCLPSVLLTVDQVTVRIP